ncbi:MAG: hypothetical protein Q9209_003888 [Squamulea sp. 1 TL-2023]
MPFLFSAVTDLLQALEDNATSTKRAMEGWLDQKNKDHIDSWVRSYKVTIDSPTVDAVSVLSALFPDKRTDRVYGLQAPSLSKILGRCFRLGVARIKQLDQWKNPGNGDLGVCVERTLRETEHGPNTNPVSLNEIDTMLHNIAAKSRFSAPNVRSAAKDNGIETSKTLESIYRRLSSCEAKWLTRMILKDFSTLDFKSYHVLNAIDPGLVNIMNVQSTYEAAVGFLRYQKTLPESQALPITSSKPVLGSKIGRVPYMKGQSVKNVVKLAGGRKFSVEQKYDGEYCQVHVDLAKGDGCIQIFSKSGKDSTKDRQRLHGPIKQSLRIGKPGCKFRRKCILEGEMVVYSEQEDRIMDFHKIRKHVSRSGSFLGTELDSQAHEYEHLMIAYYDVMVVDDDVVMNNPHSTRRRRLQDLVTCGRGMAIISKQKTVDFSSNNGPEKLRTLFATAITHRWEGLVLKPFNEPYFSSRQSSGDGPPRGWIKLKKDYIPGLGDTADFAVIGAGYDASKAAQLKCPSLKWTNFHLGCLRNKKEVKNKNARPYFVVVGALNVNLEMTKHLNQHGQFCAVPFGSLQSYQDPFIINSISKNIPPMHVLFGKPFVLDVVGAGFDKEGNRDYFTLRFPRAIKIHSDRHWKDSVSFDELQQMAKVSRTVPADTKAEVTGWEKQLDEVDRGAKGSHVPWDLSDDDHDFSDSSQPAKLTTESRSRVTRRRSSVVPPMIRMDTQEMTTKEQRLNTGEVVERPSQRSHISNWSDSNLPTPPKSSPAQVMTPIHGRQVLAAIRSSLTDQSSTPYSRQALSSILSTNSTGQSHKRSTADDEETPKPMTSKKRCVSPPVQETKRAACSGATSRPPANSKASQEAKYNSHPPTSKSSFPPKLPTTITLATEAQGSKKLPTSGSFLVPKLSIGVAEALRSKTKPRLIKDMEPPSPDRHTTEDEASVQSVRSTQQSLIEEWELDGIAPHDISRLKIRLPDLLKSYIVLSPDVSGMPYLTIDLLARHEIRFQQAHEVFGDTSNEVQLKPHPQINDNDKQYVVILVEGRRFDTSLEMLKYLVGRVPKDRSKFFWVFDWRLVEDMYARDVHNNENLLKKRLIGYFGYEDDGELRWLSATKQIRIVPQEKVEESRGMSASFLEFGGAAQTGEAGVSG